MRTIFLTQQKLLFAFLATSIALSGCGGNAVTTSATSTTTPPTGTTTTASGTLALTLLDSSGNAVTSISSTAPTTARATLTDPNSAPVANTVITFSTDATLATMTPSGGTALTNSSGIASVTLAPASITASGATMITATAQVADSAASASIGYSIGASSLTMSALTLGAGSTVGAPLSAFGTTSVSVTVSSGSAPITSPQTVTFSSTCSGSGTAVLTSSASTVNGVATASYRDNGCAGSDVITASLNGLAASQTATIYITAPTVGSIQFVSATPPAISLAGTGGTSTSQVAFKVVDGGGNPLSGKTVTFDLSTTVGGITLTPAAPATATSDSAGMVFTTVNAGTVSTPVRVTASTAGPSSTLNTQSNQLTITTGIPSQSSFSLAATTFNIEGWNVDGTTTTLTARLADHFSNLTPDGTAINFISEGARVAGSCVTTNGDCQVVFNSQNIRPLDGRVTVLAYAIGEESFVDLNANGVADKAPNELVVNGSSTDMPEAWVDYNENGTHDAASEPFIDFDNDKTYDIADGDYNGVLCDNIATSSAGTCSATKSIHVRGDMIIILSGSDPYISHNAPAIINLGGCGAPVAYDVRISDIHNNLMPAGTTVNFAASGNGTLVGETSFVVPNSIATVPNTDNVTPGAGNTGNAITSFNKTLTTLADANFSVTVKGDGSIDATTGLCTDPTIAGILTVTTTTPSGIATTESIATLSN
ncbi:MAG: hypothetical protein Q8O64_03340 [Sideroxyarcus sp.]|nr:hypothetical protein [Sideroxyarcus sp.]